jgi:hypothetical protein
MLAVTPGRAAALLGLLVAACHAALPFTDYVAYDDRYTINWLNQGKLAELRTFFSMAGNDLGYAYLSLFAGLPHLVTVFKVVGVASAFATGWFAFRVGSESGFLSRAEALAVAVAAVALPAFKLKGGAVYSLYDWTVAAFLLATLLALRAEARTGWGHAARRAAALGLFALSFQMPSLLVFYGGFFLLLALARQRAAGRPWFVPPVGFALRRPDYLVLPFAYWVGKEAVFPRWGVYTEYNRVGPTWERLAAGARGVADVLADPVTLLAAQPAAVVAGVLAAAVLGGVVAVRVLRPRPGDEPEPATGSAPACGLIAFGLVLLVMGTFPYAAVGKAPGPWGVPSSFAPLVPLPFALVLVGGLKLLRVPGRPAVAVLAAVGAVGAFGWWHNALSWQALEARNRALVRALHADPVARERTVYDFAHRYVIPRTADNLFGWEWVYIEAGEWGVPRSWAFNGVPDGPTPPWYVRKCMDDMTLGYDLAGVNEAGGEGAVIVRPGTEWSAPRAGLKYLWTKHARPARLDALLDRLVEVEFVPAPFDGADVRRRAGPPAPPDER